MLLPLLKSRDERGEIVRIGLAGAGQMGEGLVSQMETIYGMRVVVVADVVPGRATEVFLSAGVDGADIIETEDPDKAADAVRAGKRVATTRTHLAATTEPLDVVVEATGIPDVGARVAYHAILAGKHVMQMNVETDATVGYILRKMANAAGIVYTLTGGDEPGATMELYDFATSLGFKVVAAGKGKNNPLDRTANPDSMAETARDRKMNPKMLASFVDGTKTMVEMTSLANGIQFIPDVRGMHGPHVTQDTLAQTYVPREAGGIESHEGVVDFGLGIAPGVFVTFTTDHPKLIRDLQYLSMGPGPYWALYRPYHLTSLETPVWIARAAIMGETTLATDAPPTAEAITVAKRPLEAGETIDGLGGFTVYGLIERADTARRQHLLPLGLAPGSKVLRDIEMGETLTYDDVALDESLTVVNLRRLQDLETAEH
ncbi:MAG: NAD(P)-dependent oxidoreductase [Actinobacteria bacterium]|nr:NAD(P)-dependent oxidoreductase [Actinomycetota bacterium]